jgi:hypothetical protein
VSYDAWRRKEAVLKAAGLRLPGGMRRLDIFEAAAGSAIRMVPTALLDGRTFDLSGIEPEDGPAIAFAIERVPQIR